MGKTEKAITMLHDMECSASATTLHPVCLTLVTLIYLATMLSVPAESLSMLLWFAIYPILMAPATGLDFNRIFIKSLVAVPFALMIGVFNPVFLTEPVFSIGNLVVSRGWITFLSILVRCLLSVQALLILVGNGGFIGMCHSLSAIGLPDILITQLMMVYRYLTILLAESLDMSRARKARGYGRSHMDIRMWGDFCGQLFMRTVDRAQNIHRAMLARGFTGRMPRYDCRNRRWRLPDYLTLSVCVTAFIAMRIFNLSSVFTRIF